MVGFCRRASLGAGAAGGLASLATSAHAQTPKRGGRIRVAGATAAATDTLDPAKQSNQTDYSRGSMLYNGLTSLDGSLTPQPALAESFTTQDAKTWVFTLRKGMIKLVRATADGRERIVRVLRPGDVIPWSSATEEERGPARVQLEVLQSKINALSNTLLGLDANGQPAAPEEVAVARWRARVQIPQPDPSAGQRQIIHIEVASVPAHTRDLMPVAVNYDHLPGPLRQMLVVVETLPEILADKLVALGARPYLKARDVWDLKFLRDRAVALDPALVAAKLADYRLSPAAFRQTLQARVDHLASPDAETTFIREMSRFVDNTVASQLAIPGIARRYLDAAATCARPLLSA